MKHVDIFTDGACSGNPGPGGWGAVLRYGEVEKELCGGEAETTKANPGGFRHVCQSLLQIVGGGWASYSVALWRMITLVPSGTRS